MKLPDNIQPLKDLSILHHMTVEHLKEMGEEKAIHFLYTIALRRFAKSDGKIIKSFSPKVVGTYNRVIEYNGGSYESTIQYFGIEGWLKYIHRMIDFYCYLTPAGRSMPTTADFYVDTGHGDFEDFRDRNVFIKTYLEPALDMLLKEIGVDERSGAVAYARGLGFIQ